MYCHERPQLFFADDFFGRTEYSPTRVGEWQEELPHILRKLGDRHWLVMTSRLHLLRLAEANLDIDGHDGSFPELGDVYVSADRLSSLEKANILYRHCKDTSLARTTAQFVREAATEILQNPHYTPFRISRLADELRRGAAIDLDVRSLKALAEEVLSRPTKRMRVTFLALPPSHRWLLYSLLDGEADRLGREVRWLAAPKLKTHYERLCPPELLVPFEKVQLELCEAFISRTEAPFDGDTILDWIHPSYRDLVIDELACSPLERRRFLQCCSQKGLELATSLGGGTTGLRELPLLLGQDDWMLASCRAAELVRRDDSTLTILWRNYQLLRTQRPSSAGLKAFQSLMAEAANGYNVLTPPDPPIDSDALLAFLSIRSMTGGPFPEQSLGELFDLNALEAEKELSGRTVIWQSIDFVEPLAKVYFLLKKFLPSLLSSRGATAHELFRTLKDRVAEEVGAMYDVGERETRLSLCEELAEAHGNLARLCRVMVDGLEANDELRRDFNDLASSLQYQSEGYAEEANEIEGGSQYDGGDYDRYYDHDSSGWAQSTSQSDQPEQESLLISRIFEDL